MIAVFFLGACSSSGGPAPEISKFDIASPISASASAITGSVYVADWAGLMDLTADIVITGPVSTTLSLPIPGGSSAETGQLVPLELLLESSIPPGSYQVSITLSEGAETSNSLSATVVVQ